MPETIRLNREIVVDLLNSGSDNINPALIREAAAALILTDRNNVRFDEFVKTNDEVSSDIRDFIYGVIGAVEATSAEQQNLWAEITENGSKNGVWGGKRNSYLVTVGWIVNMPVCINIRNVTVKGHDILFYHSTSRVVDNNMVKTWLKNFLPSTARDGDQINQTDVTNFHNIFPRSKS